MVRPWFPLDKPVQFFHDFYHIKLATEFRDLFPQSQSIEDMALAKAWLWRTLSKPCGGSWMSIVKAYCTRGPQFQKARFLEIKTN